MMDRRVGARIAARGDGGHKGLTDDLEVAAQAAEAAEVEVSPAGRWRAGRWPVWVAMAVVTLATWAGLTWPLALHLGSIWTVESAISPPTVHYQPDALVSRDNLQNAFIQSVVIDNLRELRNPYLDMREGAAGPAPLHTTSLDLPWTLVVAVLWPLAGLQAAYNTTLLLSTLATGLAAFGWLRRHTRWPLLAAAGALAYTFVPNRMFHLSVHFNAVMWWAFPAVLWAFEVALDRHRGGRRWLRPALLAGAVVITVAVSGELHLIMYIAGLVCFVAAFVLIAGLLARRPGAAPARPVPWGPAGVVMAATVLGVSYAVAAFAYVFHGDVQGGNGDQNELLFYSPKSVLWLVHRAAVMLGEGTIYVGWAVIALAAAGLVAALAGLGRARAARPYAVLLVPVLFLTLGPAARVGPVRPYSFLADHVPFLDLQRVPQRLMVVTSLLLVVLAVGALDLVAGWLLAALPRAAPLFAVALVVGMVPLLHDYALSRNVLTEDLARNQVVTALRAAGDQAGPIVGVPVFPEVSTRTSATTYVAALGRRRTLNAYNQSAASWQLERMRRLVPLNRGRVDAAALRVLTGTGATQIVVINQAQVHKPGEWRSIVQGLVASGRFRLVVSDGPLALLELTRP
jgi:hypothetical protein